MVVTRWLNSFAMSVKPDVNTGMDIIFGVDNEQRHGKSFTSAVKSSLITSTICVVVAFILRLHLKAQYIMTGKTSFWRFPECNFTQREKDICLERALHGRDPGNMTVL